METGGVATGPSLRSQAASAWRPGWCASALDKGEVDLYLVQPEACTDRCAGDDYEAAVFYPKDNRFLIERDLRAPHYEVVE